MPTFQRLPSGILSLSDSAAARAVKTEHRERNRAESESVIRIKTQAERSVNALGGDVKNVKHLLGQHTIQFGQFRGMTFKWLLENAPGWVAFLIARDETSGETQGVGNRWLNKMALRRYVYLFEESKELVRMKREEKQRRTPGNQKPSSETRTLDVHVDDSELIACLEEVEGKAGKESSYILVFIRIPKPTPNLASAVRRKSSTSTSTSEDSGSSRPTSSTSAAMVGRNQQQESSSSTAPELDSLALPSGWKKTLPEVDHQWISETFFHAGKRGPEFDFSRVSKLWYDPPQPSLSRAVLNKPDRYFGHRFFLWMPRHLFHTQFHCPHSGCNGTLTNAGVHQKTRRVVDVDSVYNIAAEYLSCSNCHKKVISWSEGVLNQLDNATRSRFPCILTSKYACDLKIVRLLRQRGLGNSSSAVMKQVREQHGESYLNNLQLYLSHCRDFKTSAERGFFAPIQFSEPPPAAAVPRHRWFMKVYQIDVLNRVDYIKAHMTSQFGTVLKMDSTKKITNKLAGKGRKTAMWATNIGNEHGQVLMSVLTVGEGSGLKQMLDGLVTRYRNAGVPPPKALYVDRDCCGASSVHKYLEAWPFLHIRLDIWHFMRRFPYGCTTDKHQLYSVLMGKLSQCIFKWDETDLNLLKTAKRAEMIQQCIQNPSEDDVIRRLSTAELALHCKRVTRGTAETTRLISSLLESLDGPRGFDTQGVPLFDSEKIQQIWKIQSQHVSCIQDPPGLRLYTQVNTLKKGGIELPVYRCARGSTSLESFHLHMNRFIPGTLAKDINFQVFLLDGLFRWNSDRKSSAVVDVKEDTPMTYSGPLKNSVNKLANEVLGRGIFDDYKPPGKYTGELIGIEYLYSQTGEGVTDYREAVRILADDADVEEENPEHSEADEGFHEQQEEMLDPTLPVELSVDPVELGVDPVTPTCTSTSASPALLNIPSVAEYRQMMAQSDPAEVPTHHYEAETDKSKDADSGDDTVGPDNVPGYSRVLALADFLVTFKDKAAMTSAEVQKLKDLWSALSEYDRKRTVFPQRFSTAPLGRFCSKRKKVAPGVESIEKVILGPNQGPAQWPNCNRYTEATVEKLLQIYPSDRRRKGEAVLTKWSLILDAYHTIRKTILNNHRAMSVTDIQLPLLNRKTLQQWFNEKSKAEEKKILMQGLALPTPKMTVAKAPEALPKPTSLPAGSTDPFSFHDPPSTIGMAKLKSRPKKTPKAPIPAVAPVLPCPTPSCDPVMSFQLVTTTEGTALLIPNIPHSTKQYQKRKQELEEQGRPKRKYVRTSTVIRCSKCGEDMKPPDHSQYMGYRYCARKDNIPFQEWRDNLQKAGVARKKKTQQ